MPKCRRPGFSPRWFPGRSRHRFTHPKKSCPKCGGKLIESVEPRSAIKGGFALEKERQAAMNKPMVAVEQQTYRPPTKTTVKEYPTKEWLPAVKATIRPSTCDSYVQHVGCHIAPHIGAVKLAKLTGSRVNALYAKLAETGKKDGRKGPLTLDRPPRPRLPAQGVQGRGQVGPHRAQPARCRRPAAEKRRQQQGDADLTDDRLHPLWHPIAMTGMRRGQALGLRWSDVDLENSRLSVHRALIPIKGGVVVSEPKTAKGRRVIALDPATVEVLEAQAARQGDERKRCDEAWVGTGLVFTLENGEALNPEDVSRYWRLAVKKAMLPPIRLRDLRHTHATLALQAGVHPTVVSERLGHATVSITLDTYSHDIPAPQEEAATIVAGLVFAQA